MASNDDHHADLEEPEEFDVPQGFYTYTLAMAGVGALAFLVGLFAFETPRRAWNAYLIGFWFSFGLGVAGPFLLATQYVSTASWFVPIKRVPEAFGNFLFVAAPLGIAMLFGAKWILPWHFVDGVPISADDLSHHAEHFLHLKEGFLNMTGLTLTTVIVPIALAGLGYWLRHNSVAQDESGDGTLYTRNKIIGVLFLLCFGVGFSLMSWYWGISLEPLWYATMWQVYQFAGIFQTGLAVITIAVILLQQRGAFGDLIGEDQIHALGQLVFTFTVFYAYIAFAQFMLCWYANIPEESLFYIRRLGGPAAEVAAGGQPADVGGYGWFTALWLGKFVAPFLILLPQDIKKNARNILYYVCWVIAFTQVYELWFWIDFTPANPNPTAEPTLHIPWFEALVVMGFVGLFLAVVGWSLSRASIVALKDPFLPEALEHGHDHGEEPPDEWQQVLESS